MIDEEHISLKAVPHAKQEKAHVFSVPKIIDDKCVRCKRCFTFCPLAAISWKERPVIDCKICNGCMICRNECIAKAIE